MRADEALLARDEIQKVLSGGSAIGALAPYFIDQVEFNKKHGIEDDSGRTRQALVLPPVISSY